MPIAGFNHEEFAKNLAQQAREVVPPDISQQEKAYIVNLVYQYCMIAGNELNKDPQSPFNVEQARIICQLIGEWTYHKTIDIIHAQLPPEYRDQVLQSVAFTVFEMAKLGLSKNLQIQQLLMVVEEKVKQAFDSAIEDLKKRNLIDEQLAQTAISNSNIDDMAAAQQAQEQQHHQETTNSQQVQQQKQEEPPPNSQKILKLASLALLIKRFPPEKKEVFLRKFSTQDRNLILQYLEMPDLETKLDAKIAIKCLNEMKQNLPETKASLENKIKKNFNKVINNSDFSKISGLVSCERTNIKKIINFAHERKNIDFPTPILEVISKYLEENIYR